MKRLACTAAVVVAALAFPAVTFAATSFTSFDVSPSTIAAGGHPNLTMTFGFTPSSATDQDTVKDLEVRLAPGLIGDPNATARCSQAQFTSDSCPANTQVGTVSVAATAFVVLVPVSTTASGEVYNLAPTGSEPGRLGLLIKPLTGPLTGNIHLQSGIDVLPDEGYGLRTKFTDIPNMAAALVPLRIDSQTLTLFGMVSGKPFVRNPTSCSAASTRATASFYSAPATKADRFASFTPTNCDALPYSPTVSGSIGGAGATAAGAHPSLTTVIDFPSDQAGTKRTELILPADVVPSAAALGNACPIAMQPSSCPASSVVGTATATTPLLATPFAGPVILAQRSSGLPGLTVLLSGAFPLRLEGTTEIGAFGTKNVFDNLPDQPLSRFVLSLNGGAAGLLQNLADLCRAGAKTTATGLLVAHNGKSVPVNAPLAVNGCSSGGGGGGGAGGGGTSPGSGGGGTTPAAGAPRTKAGLRFRHGRGRLVIRLRAGRGAPALSRVRLRLPHALRPRGKQRRILVVLAGGRRLPSRASRLRGRRLLVRLPRGSRFARISLGGLRPSRALRRQLAGGVHPRVAVRLVIRDADDMLFPRRLRPRARGR